MKLIIAYVQPEKLNDVKQALYAAEVFKISVSNALGCGQQKGYHETYRGVDVEVNLLKKVRIEIAVNDLKLEGRRLFVILNDNEMSIAPPVRLTTSILTSPSTLAKALSALAFKGTLRPPLSPPSAVTITPSEDRFSDPSRV